MFAIEEMGQRSTGGLLEQGFHHRGRLNCVRDVGARVLQLVHRRRLLRYRRVEWPIRGVPRRGTLSLAPRRSSCAGHRHLLAAFTQYITIIVGVFSASLVAFGGALLWHGRACCSRCPYLIALACGAGIVSPTGARTDVWLG